MVHLSPGDSHVLRSELLIGNYNYYDYLYLYHKRDPSRHGSNFISPLNDLLTWYSLPPGHL